MDNRVKISLMVFVFAASLFYVDAAGTTDTLFQRLSQTPIGQMSDPEYEYFLKIHGRHGSGDRCNDFQLNEILKSRPTIASMTGNEARYFDNMVYECESINPCTLPQFVALQKKDTATMSNEEYFQLTELREHCAIYMEKYHPTRDQTRVKIGFTVLTAVVIMLGIVVGILVYQVNGPGGR
ncbi:MAG TPA: hypothetical protein VLX68_17390 [Chitinivibrionales bacterium]|nr:hypothetical protein [Chitinivibrionales bacterium]